MALHHGATLTLAALRAAVAGGRRRVPAGVAVLLQALDARMNATSVFATLPLPPGGDVAGAFARWLDAGAPGLADAARDCDQDGHFEQVRPGPPPRLRGLDRAGFLAMIDAMLTTSRSFYRITIAEPEAVRDAFVAEALASGASAEFFAADVQSLAPRFEYFDGMDNDHCLVWTSAGRLHVLLTNGSD